MSDYSVSSDTSDGPQGSIRRTTAPAMSAVENAGYGGKARSLSLSRPSPFSTALSVLSNGSEAEKANAGEVRRRGVRLAMYLCRKGTKRTGDEIGEVSLESSTVNPYPI